MTVPERVPTRTDPEPPVSWVALVGFMGTGKSRIGWELSRILRLTFIDTDKVIERITCLTIPEILDLYGEATFRDYETEVVRRSLRLDRAVISTGGGTVVRDENRSLLAGRGPVVRLNATAETIYKRTRRHKRPLLEVGDPTDRIKHLLRERESHYREVASFTVESDDRDSSDVVADVVAGLRRWADRHPNHEAVQGQSGP